MLEILYSLSYSVVVILVAFIFWRVLDKKLIFKLFKLSSDDIGDKQIQTFLPLFRNICKIILFLVCTAIILKIWSVNLTPLLASVGGAGIVVGFGAQAIIKDVFSGVSMILSGALRMGDWVIINGKNGEVEQVSSRNVNVRDIYGDLHIIPWGSVTELTNQTKEYGYSVVSMTIPYSVGINNALQVLKDVLDDFNNNMLVISEKLDSPVTSFGVTDFKDKGFEIMIRAKTSPKDKWAVAATMRKKIKEEFEKNEISMSIYTGKE